MVLEMSNPIYRSGKVIAEMIEMNKLLRTSALAMAGMFSTRALADENKTGFYVTGKTRCFLLCHLQTSVSCRVMEETSKYKRQVWP